MNHDTIKHAFVLFPQELLTSASEGGGPGESLSMMYGTLLRNFESTKDDYNLVRTR